MGLKHALTFERLSRRDVFAMAAAGILSSATPTLGGNEAAAFIALERRHGGRLGVFAIDLQKRRVLTYRARAFQAVQHV